MSGATLEPPLIFDERTGATGPGLHALLVGVSLTTFYTEAVSRRPSQDCGRLLPSRG
jgi:hypothetical protein